MSNLPFHQIQIWKWQENPEMYENRCSPRSTNIFNNSKREYQNVCTLVEQNRESRSRYACRNLVFNTIALCFTRGKWPIQTMPLGYLLSLLKDKIQIPDLCNAHKQNTQKLKM